MSALPPPPPPPPGGPSKAPSAPPPPPGAKSASKAKTGGAPPPPPPPGLAGFKPKTKKLPPTKRPEKKEKKREPMKMVAPAGGVSLMDELALKFKKNQKEETSIGDDDPTPNAAKKQESVEEEKIETTKSPQIEKTAVSAFDDMDVDETGAISVNSYALGEKQPNFVKPTLQPPAPPKKPVEEVKNEPEEEDEDDIENFLKNKRQESRQDEPDEDDKEDEENMKAVRMSTFHSQSQKPDLREITIQDAQDFLKTDEATYSKTTWVEIINEEGDKVYLNRVTGEIALTKPDNVSQTVDSSTSDGLGNNDNEENNEDWRWLPDKEEAWIPSQFIKKRSNGKYEYQDIEGIMFTISEKMHNKGIKFDKKSLQNYVHDLLMLDEINEANILYNIKNRFNKHRIYTRLGKILISVNPYKLYPLYTPEVIEKYKNARNVNQLPPHIYEVAKGAIEELIKTKHPQSILIAGESGSGKTEASKQCMQYLAEVAGSESDMEKRLLDCNPILESIGNAQTIRNDNSSRFGKWSEINFDENSKIIAGKITDYLLEKSRVSHQEKGERNYHIFYQICRGLSSSEKDKYYLTEVDDYKYLTKSNKTTIKNVNDSEVFKETLEAMENILSKDHIDQIFKILSAILLLGNIEFKDNEDDSTSISKSSEASISKISKLLDIDESQFSQFLLIKKSVIGNNEMISNLNIKKSEEARHALARLIYHRLFQEVVSLINETLTNSEASKSSIRRYIGILDIYGFEIFKNNSFEQFSINYANEKMQQHFVKYTFKTEEKIYEDDGIEFNKTEYKDNMIILEVIEDKNTGIISLLDDELRIPQSSDERLMDKLESKNKDKKEAFRRDFKTKNLFTIMHFAGDVDYNINGFVEKNRDQTTGNMKEVMQNSGLDLVNRLFPKDESTTNKATKSLAYQFRSQLNILMNTLEDTNPFYIKCIKPNHQKSSSEFDPTLVIDQLKSTRIVESLEIVQKGYPYRMTYREFAARYKVINPNYTGTDYKKASELILGKLPYEISRFKKGHKFCHYKSEDNKFLEAQRNVNIDKLIAKVQNFIRKRNAERLYRELKKYKQICLAAIKDESIEVIEGALRKGENLPFIIKEHKQLKKLHFKIEEEVELQRELADLANLKKEKDLSKLKKIVDRADHIGFNTDEMAKLREMYEKANEIAQVKGTLHQALDSFVEIEALRNAIERAKSLDEVDDDLIQKAKVILERSEKEIELFRKVLAAFSTGCPIDIKEATSQVKFDHIEPLVQEFRLIQPFYNTHEFPQHLYEFEIMLNMRKAVKSEDFDTLQTCMIKTNDVKQNTFFQHEIGIMGQIVAHFGEVEKIKTKLWESIDIMDLRTIRYCMDQGDLYNISWENVEREDDGVHQACKLSSIVNTVIAEASVSVNVMERAIMKRWLDTLSAFKIDNEVTKALIYLLTEIDEEKFNQVAYKAAVHLRDEQLIIWRTIKMKEKEFEGEKNIHKWILSSCHLLKDPDEWASSVGFFKNKKDKAKGFYFHQSKSIHESL